MSDTNGNRQAGIFEGFVKASLHNLETDITKLEVSVGKLFSKLETHTIDTTRDITELKTQARMSGALWGGFISAVISILAGIIVYFIVNK